MNKIPIQRISFPILYGVLVKKQGELIMKRYFIASALSGVLIFSSFTAPKLVYADSLLQIAAPTPVVMNPITRIVIKAIIRGSGKIIRLALINGSTWAIEQVFENGQWVELGLSSLAKSSLNIALEKDVWNIKENGESIGKGVEAELSEDKWVTKCNSNFTADTIKALGQATGVTGGAWGGAALGAVIATSSCLGSIGLTAATFGAGLLLSVGVCGSAIATGTAIGTTFGGALGGVFGTYTAKELIAYFDIEHCVKVKKESTVKVPSESPQTIDAK